MMTSSKKIIVALTVFAFVAGGVTLYSFMYSPSKNTISTEPDALPSPSLAVASPAVVVWKNYTVPELQLSYEAPSDMEVNYEVQPNLSTGKPSTLTLYIQKSTPHDAQYYQLYGLYQFDLPTSDSTLNEYKSGMVAESIKESSFSGLRTLQGQIKGERSRFVTYIELPSRKGIFSLYTAGPTEKNRQITESILSTFNFAK